MNCILLTEGSKKKKNEQETFICNYRERMGVHGCTRCYKILCEKAMYTNEVQINVIILLYNELKSYFSESVIFAFFERLFSKTPV